MRFALGQPFGPVGKPGTSVSPLPAPVVVSRTVVSSPSARLPAPPSQAQLARRALERLSPDQRAALFAVVGNRVLEDHGFSPAQSVPETVRVYNLEKTLVDDSDLIFAADDEEGSGEVSDHASVAEVTQILSHPGPVPLTLDNTGAVSKPLPRIPFQCSPRDLVKFCQNPLISWLDHYLLHHPEARDKMVTESDDNDPNLNHWRDEGLRHEAAYLQALKDGKFREHFPHLKEGESLSVVEIAKMEDGDWNNPEAHESRYQATLAAMREGHDVVFQAYVRSDDGVLYGFADFLVKVPNPPGIKSAFGDFHYEPWDTKLAKKEKIEYLIQLSSYADMLADMQKFRPTGFSIVNGDSQKLSFDLGQYFATYEEIRNMFIEFIRELEREVHNSPNPPIDFQDVADDPELELEQSLERLPVIPKAQGYGRYSTFVLDLLRKRDALTYVAGINNTQIVKLAKVDIKTMTALADLEYEPNEEGDIWFYRRGFKSGTRERVVIDDLDDVTVQRLIDQARIQVRTLGPLQDLSGITPKEARTLRLYGINYIKDLSQVEKTVDGISQKRFDELVQGAKDHIVSFGLTKPLYEVKPVSSDNPHSGLALLPPVSKNDVYTDFEWLPGKDGWTYLFMAVYDDPRTGKTERKAFWAYSKDEEKKTFEAYIDWLYARFKNDPQMHAYHFTAAEPTVIRRLSEKYGTRIREVRQMFRASAFVDTFGIMKQSMRIGSYSYGMKKVEPIFMGPRVAPVQSATDSILWFQKWVDHPDGKTVQDSATLKANEDYCGEDCLGQRGHTLWLRAEQKKHGIDFNPAREAKKSTPSKEEIAIDNLKQDLRHQGQRLSGAKTDPEYDRIFSLLSALPDYHDREASMVFRAKFERAAMTQEDLVNDLATLGALTLVSGSETARPSRRKTYLGIDAFARSQKVYANKGQGDLTDVNVLPESAHPERSQVLQRLTLNRTKKPEKPKRSTDVIYTFQGTPGVVEDIEVGQKLFFENGTFSDQNNAWGKIESVDSDTGQVRIRFNAKTLSQLDGRAPLQMGITTNRTTTRQYTYEFDPAQMTKLGVNDTCFLASDLTVSCKIKTIDYKAGRVTVEFGPSAMARLGGKPQQEIALIPNEYVSAKTIQDAIIRQLQGLIPDKENKIIPLPKAMSRLLRRESPQIVGRAPDAPVVPPDLSDEETTLAITRAVTNLKGSTLVMQGPPGTGKSYQGKIAIVELIKKARAEGKKIKIGITANSHLSGLNLAEMVARELAKQGIEPKMAKVGDGAGSLDVENLPPGIVFKRDVGALMATPRGHKVPFFEDVEIVVGTAWTFSNKELTGEFDYLFVDDASQVSLANLFGMGQSLKRQDVQKGTGSEDEGSIVLLGDHRQLDQPSQAAHPDGADNSAIEYYLDGQDVIPARQGVFLKKTWRNHSKITQAYSSQVYHGQVESHPDNDEQKINIPRQRGRRHKLKYIKAESGFVYVPVQHRDNIHKSTEEVDVIRDIVAELHGLTFTDRDGNTRNITRDDIMVVAPYNLQTRHLAMALGDQAQVGTIDKFQGREAPVVIVSMSASQIHPSSPLMRFEFDERRLNVAFSRAQAMVIVVGSDALKKIRPRSPRQMKSLNFYHLATSSKDRVDPSGREHLRTENTPL